MGRTLPTASMLLRIEESEWKPFRDALNGKDRKTFDDLFDSAHQFNYAMMSAMPNIPIPIRLVFMAVIFGHYKELNKMLKALDDSENTKTVE